MSLHLLPFVPFSGCSVSTDEELIGNLGLLQREVARQRFNIALP